MDSLLKCDFETLDRINRNSGQNWKSTCFLTVFKHKFCTLNACQYNYRLHGVMKFDYHTFKSIFNKNICKKLWACFINRNLFSFKHNNRFSSFESGWGISRTDNSISPRNPMRHHRFL